MQIKKKILIPIILVILFLLSVTVYSIYKIQNKSNTEDILEHLTEVEHVFESSLDAESNMIASHIDYMKKDSTILKAYQNKDKDALYDYCSPIFEDIRTKYKITHFYFIDTSGTCFLRVHNKPKNGDTIKRFTFADAKQTGKPAYGIELGTFGTFTLRHVSPKIVDGEILYYIELGMEIEHITTSIKKMVGVDLVFAIDKEFTNKEKWEMGLEMSGKQGDWNEFENFIVIDKTIDDKFDFSEIVKNEKKELTSVASKNKIYGVGTIPLIDVGDRMLGKIIVLEEITEQRKAIKILFFILIGISLAALIVLIMFFYKYISKIENNINTAYNKLDVAKQQLNKDKDKIQEKNNELTAAEEELRQNNEELLTLNENLNDANDLVHEKNKIIEVSHKKIKDSINYAKRIQDSLLTSKKIIDTYLNEYFILYKPKDVVSGDFYYINKINNKIIIAAADCTGHGVPGGFITMLGITYLHEIIRKKEVKNPGEVLNELRFRFKNTFATFGSENQNGLDIAFCSIDTDTNTLQYAGANNPLIIVRDNKLIEYKATPNPIGYYPKEKDFENNIMQIQKEDIIYLFSDGFHDQLGGKRNKKFMSRKFKNLLLKNHKLPIKQQEQELITILKNWKGEQRQIDDILVMGVKI